MRRKFFPPSRERYNGGVWKIQVSGSLGSTVTSPKYQPRCHMRWSWDINCHVSAAVIASDRVPRLWHQRSDKFARICWAQRQFPCVRHSSVGNPCPVTTSQCSPPSRNDIDRCQDPSKADKHSRVAVVFAAARRKACSCFPVRRLVDRAGIFVVKKNALPGRASIFGAKHATFGCLGRKRGPSAATNSLLGSAGSTIMRAIWRESSIRCVSRIFRRRSIYTCRRHKRYSNAYPLRRSPHKSRSDLKARRRLPRWSDRLRIKYRIPGAPRIVGSPHAAIHGSKIKDFRLTANTGNRQGPSAAMRADGSPAQPLKQFLVELFSCGLRVCRRNIQRKQGPPPQ